MTTVAECIIDILINLNVKRIYGIAGDSLNAFTDAIRTRQKIKWVSMRHEESAAFAAGAEAQLSDTLAVCAGSCGPGNMHLINGLYDCHRNKVPILAIAAQIPTSEIGGDYFQETHPERIFLECSQFCETVSQPEQIPRLVEIAIQQAIASRDVSVLIIPGDIAWKQTKARRKARLFFSSSIHLHPSTDKNLEQVAQILNKSLKTTIFGGLGCATAHQELLLLADRLKAPIVHTLRGKEFIEYENPFDVGLTGLLGLPSAYHALMECDTLLLLGNNFPYRQFYPTDATVIQIDHRGENIGKRTHVDYAVIGDVKHVLRDLLQKVDTKEDNSFLEKSRHNFSQSQKELNSYAIESPPNRPIHPQYLVKLINDYADSDAIFTCDVGTPTIWAARYLKMNGKRKLLGSFNHGSMASAMPQAIGAQLQTPFTQVISLSGDGGLAMLLGDLLTIKQYSLPIKIVVFNNSAYSFVELEMKSSGILEYGTDLLNPDFSKLAESIGIFGIQIKESQQLPQALKKALAHKGPALIEVMVNRNELAFPPKITTDEIAGFSLYLLTAVFNGKGDQLIDLAKTNFINK